MTRLPFILGGGQGTRCFLSPQHGRSRRSRLRKYRLVDGPVSGCMPPKSARIFVLTQFQFRVAQSPHQNTYQLDRFSAGSSRSLPRADTENPHWYQERPTPSGKRCDTRAARSRSLSILAGDHLYRMDYSESFGTHKDTDADNHDRRTAGGSGDRDAHGDLPVDAAGRMSPSRKNECG